MLPLENWRPTNLYLKEICVICKAASVYVWFTAGTAAEDFEMSQV